jgi:2-amino-4-hydroxy-6-hydroxymethyldihydropteridine diphosphokinase
MGSRAENCMTGINLLDESEESSLLARSLFYYTEPVDYMDQDWFVNIAVKIETTLDPFQLIKKLKKIETDSGRIADTIRFGPRILDMDIILYDDMVIDSKDLIIPHPRMHERCFVLKPLCDIDSEIIHPLSGKKIKALLDNLNNEGQKVIPYKCSQK